MVKTDFNTVSSGKVPFEIFTKLKELYEEEIAKNSTVDSCETSLLLEKLIARERLNTLIFNLYPGNKGYSLAFPTEDTASMIETNPWPYEEGTILRHIDNEELPPYIVDLLEPKFSYLFYSGCIIAEIRDYRQAYPHYKCGTHHVLLRPTFKNVLADKNILLDDKVDWNTEEKDQLESQLLIANEPTLCLDPDSSISSYTVKIGNQRKIFNTQKFRRMAKKFSQVTVNRKRKLDQFTYRHGMELFEFISRTKSKPKMGAAVIQKGLTLTKRSFMPSPSPVDNSKLALIPAPTLAPPVQLTLPTEPIIIQSFKMYPRPRETSDCLPQLIEEYVLETEMPSKDKGRPRVYHIKLSILQRPSNYEYLGELYLDRDHKKNEQNGVSCRFSLGSKANVHRYINQFYEIFTESGRKSTRIRYGCANYKGEMMIPQIQSQQNQQIQQNQNQQSHVIQSVSQVKPVSQALSSQEQAINVLATKLMNSAQQFQAASR